MGHQGPPPFQYQKEGVYQIEAWGGRVLLADEMGLGKTPQSLHYLRRNPAARPAAVVCPNGLKYNWKREAWHHCGLRAEVLEGSWPPPHPPIFAHDLYVLNYDIVGGWIEWLHQLGVRTIILDECQYVKNLEAQRTIAVQALCRGRPHVIAMSGTPMENCPAELFPVLHILRPDIWRNWPSYAKRYCSPKYRYGKWQCKGAVRKPELNQLLVDNVMIRRLKRNVLHQLPPMLRTVVPLELSDPEGHYERARTDFLGWLSTISVARAIRASKAEKLTQLGYLKRLAARYKLPAACAWVDDFFVKNPGEKLIVFGCHSKLLDALMARYGKLGVRVDGTTDARVTQYNIDRFRNDPGCQLLAGNIQSAGAGHNLVECATIAMMELEWRPSLHMQAEKRIDRIGQELPTWVYYLVAMGTIEEKLCEVLQDKQGICGDVLDGKGEGEELNVLDLMLQFMGESV